MYKTLHKKQGSVTVQLRFARSSVTFCAKRDNTIMSKYYYEYSDKSIKYCANCWAAKMCPFCYADRMTENGISDNAHLHCAEARNHLKKQFSLYHEILENNPQKLEVLNKYEIK